MCVGEKKGRKRNRCRKTKKGSEEKLLRRRIRIIERKESKSKMDEREEITKGKTDDQKG